MPDIRIPKEAVIVQPDPISERIDRYHADMLALSTRFRDERTALQAAFENDITALVQSSGYVTSEGFFPTQIGHMIPLSQMPLADQGVSQRINITVYPNIDPRGSELAREINKQVGLIVTGLGRGTR